MLKLVFNPFLGKFDYIDVTDTSAFAPVTPTSQQADSNIAEHTQMLFRQHMIIGSRSIVLGQDASLVGV